MNKKLCIAAVFAFPYAIFTAEWLRSLHHPFGVHSLVFYPILAIQELPKIAQQTFNYGKWPGIYIAIIFAAIAVFGLLIYFILLYFGY